MISISKQLIEESKRSKKSILEFMNNIHKLYVSDDILIKIYKLFILGRAIQHKNSCQSILDNNYSNKIHFLGFELIEYLENEIKLLKDGGLIE